MHVASRTIDKGSIIGGILTPGTISDKVVKAYRDLAFGTATLQDLPDDRGAGPAGPTRGPRFVINATSVQSGVLFRFSKPYAWDDRVGKIASPPIELAVAVAASSAFIIHALGPSREDEVIRDMEPPAGKSYLGLAATIDEENGERAEPFSKDWWLDYDAFPVPGDDRVRIRRFSDAPPAAVAAALDGAVNGTSLTRIDQ